MHQKDIRFAGKKITEAGKAVIMLHGRGATAEGIMDLAFSLNVKEYAVVAPQATNYSWYPYSFMANPAHNEPWLSSALDILKEVVADLNAAGIADEKIYFTGFSQGACLTLEFITRNARQWGGAVAFTGGLIGDRVYKENYKGDFRNTPVFIGTSNPDPHVPVERVQESVKLMREMNAAITEKVYPNMGHTIIEDEIKLANQMVFK